MAKRQFSQADKTSLKNFMPYLGHYRGAILGAFVSGILGGGSSVIVTYEVGRAVNQIKGTHDVDFAHLFPILGLLLLLYVINVVTVWAINLFVNQVGYFAVRDLRNDAFQHLNSLPVQFFDEHSEGDLLSRFTSDLDFVSDAIVQIFNTLFSGMMIVALSFVFMLFLSPILTIVVACATVLMYIVTMAVARGSQFYFSKQQKILGQISGFVTEYVGQQKTVKAFTEEKHEEHSFSKLNNNYYTWGQKATFVSALSNPTTRFVDHLGYLSIGVVGGLMILGGYPGISVGLISSFILYSSQFTTPFQNLSAVTQQIQTALAGLTRIFQVVEATPEPSDADKQQLLTAPKEIDFDHVYFAYEPDEPLIENLNLAVHNGESVAIVGETGAGKTTLVNLLMRFYDVNSGAIQVDGNDIRSYTRDSYRRQFGMVLQDTWIFKGTVRENLTFGNPDATDAQIKAAIHDAQLDHFIASLPNGLDTVIGGNATSISSGQMQLLTIARVMLMNPPILILDEATSELDTLTEADIQHALDILMKGKTSFVIAHRLATIQNADTILVMAHGHIVEMGNHQELLAKKGAYYDLYNAQFKGKKI
ncbi:ABC transporter-like protein [Lactobacillus selangorensis]|uniref:ABC transporter-like protein n=1 Tax=Lactobacillus selangorensis TaxID=81857 RepID=A0A0R2FHB0_9LACO|nr:ABC transporter ATP-binding protein [Lactobacillus selangorensis]KRN28009.1 ABC transporter-like protein [Lactobacillus selangorensis]KRN30520.1 ABC transporter-like protein [Lactobacillus selangorensis]